nr:hypothetical protein [Tanacetum cinerariifolium]
MDEALVPMAQRLKIGRSNFRLLSDIKSKESTLQLFYDVLRRCPFFNAFLVTADVRELKPKLYDGCVIVKSDAIVIHDSEETLLLAEESRSKMIEKQNDLKMAEKKVITKPIDYAVL